MEELVGGAFSAMAKGVVGWIEIVDCLYRVWVNLSTETIRNSQWVFGHNRRDPNKKRKEDIV